jgi:omega-6 fatty acid desaturase (delta-12 desaturase)
VLGNAVDAQIAVVWSARMPTDQARAGSAGSRPRAPRPDPRLAPYTVASHRAGAFDLATSVLPYLALLALAYVALDVSVLLTLAIGIVAGGFLLRTFIVFHDCAHGSFTPSSTLNTWIGRTCGLLVLTPFRWWRRSHAVHHGTAGDLDRRGTGDILTLTTAEYLALPRWGQLRYRLVRNPFVLFGLGWMLTFVLGPRVVSPKARPEIRNSVLATNVCLVLLVAGACLLVGWREYLLLQVPPVFVAGSAGIWIFYVNHQFEDTYWQRSDDWSYADAALAGSSYLNLPAVLRFFSGNIGYHHVHHLSPQVPNYNLRAAHAAHPAFRDVPEISLSEGLRATRLKLWDERRGRLVTFAEAEA